MMIKEKAWTELNELPPDAQYQVMEFIAFLHTRYQQKTHPESEPETLWKDEPFWGMWKDREEMDDSSAWVRNLRHTEWNRINE